MISQAVSALFDEIVDRTPVEREAALASVTLPIATEVRSLLGAFDLAPDFLQQGVAHDTSDADLTKHDVVGKHLRDAPLHAGTRINAYTVIREIGQGGMGIVYEAEQQEPRRRVAVKVLRPGVWGTSQLRRFKREAEALGRLQHPGIAAIFEARATTLDPGSSENAPYIAMELIEGVPIDQFCQKQSLGPAEIVALIRDVAEALEHAHARGVIHRDLSPSNILVEQRGRARIVDFGIARLLDSVSESQTIGATSEHILGKWAYMAPEQTRGDTPVDHRADVFALGSVLYTLLAGRPWLDTNGRTAFQLLRLIEHDPVPQPRIAPCRRRRDLAAITATAMHRQSARRYQSAGELRADLDRWRTGLKVMAREPGLIERSRLFVTRHRLLTAVAASTVLTLGVGLVVASSEARRAREAERATARTLHQVITEVVQSLQQSRAALSTRAAILDKLRPQVDRLLAAQPEDAEVRLAASWFYRELALVVGYPYTPNLGRFDEAMALLRLSADIASSPRTEHEQDVRLALCHAEVISLMAAAMYTKGRTADIADELFECFKDCRIRQSNAADPRQWERVKFSLAVHVANALVADDRTQQAREVLSSLTKEAVLIESRDGLSRDVGRIWHGIARAAREIPDHEATIAASQRARTCYLASETGDALLLQWVGDTHRYEGMACRDKGVLTAAESNLSEAIAFYFKASAADPSRADVLSVQALAYLDRAVVRNTLRDPGAIKDARMAVDLRRKRAEEEAAVPAFRLALADSLDVLASILADCSVLEGLAPGEQRDGFVAERSRSLAEAIAIRGETNRAGFLGSTN